MNPISNWEVKSTCGSDGLTVEHQWRELQTLTLSFLLVPLNGWWCRWPGESAGRRPPSLERPHLPLCTGGAWGAFKTCKRKC